MLTASFFTYQGPGRISIARGAPRGMSGFAVYRKLAPGPWFKSVGPQEYADLYFEQLDRLDPQRVWDELHALVHPHTPVLLCWERPPLTGTDRWWETKSDPGRNWCHRTLVSHWMFDALGVQVPELDTAPPVLVHRSAAPKQAKLL